MEGKEVFPYTVFMRGEEQDLDGCQWIHWDVGDKPENIARVDRVKRVGVYRLEKIVNVGCQVIVTDPNGPPLTEGE
jgi:hypothetical protein